MQESKFLIYETDDGKINIDVILKDETIWSSQKNMARLFDTTIDNVSLHLKNIYFEGELDKDSTTEEISIVQKEGNRNVTRKILFYNLDAIGAVGIARAFAFGGANDMPIWIPEIPFVKRDYQEGVFDPSEIHHFYSKLLRLKDNMNTKTGKKMAYQRHEFMELYLNQFFSEWNGEK